MKDNDNYGVKVDDDDNDTNYDGDVVKKVIKGFNYFFV